MESTADPNRIPDAAQEYLNKVSPLGTPLSEADSHRYRELLSECGRGDGVGAATALNEPRNHRFAPIPLKSSSSEVSYLDSASSTSYQRQRPASPSGSQASPREISGGPSI